MSGQPIWFDPKMFAETRSYVAAIWIAGTLPAVIVGGVGAGPLFGLGPVAGVLIGVTAWSILLAGAAPRLAARKRSRLDERRRLLPCPSCGEDAFGTTCGACGSSLEPPAATI